MSELLDKAEFERRLRQIGEERYHDKHPFHRLMHEGKRGAREGEGLYDWRGRDLGAYQRELLGRLVALFKNLNLLPPPR